MGYFAGMPHPEHVMAEAFGMKLGEYPKIPASWNKDHASSRSEDVLNSMLRDGLKGQQAQNENNQAQESDTTGKTEAELKCEEAIKRFESSPVNESGLKLQEQFDISKTVDTILEDLK